MFKKMKLRQRILLGYLAPLMLLLGAMSLVFVNLQKATHVSAAVEASHLTMGEARDLAFTLAKMQRAARGYLLVKNPTSRQTFLDSEKEFISRGEKLTSLVQDPQQLENLRSMLSRGQDLIKLDNQFLVLVDEGKQAEAQALFSSGEGIKESTEVDAQWDRFRLREIEIVKERQDAYDAAIRTVTNSIIYGMLGAIVLAIATAFWLAASVSRNISANASQLSAAASEIAATIAQHERTASQQAAAANETSATIEELSASSCKSAEQAANAAAVAEKAGVATVQGDETTRQAVLAMSSLKDKIGAMADQILHLGEQTGQIGSTATVLKDLAGQINMLALNAAVEAARAGEHGKGFAVVASEIRKLADESKKSAEQTAVLVADIQKATNSSIMMTEEGTHTVIEVTQLVQKVAELFNNLASLAGSANENAQQVMLNARQQSAAFGQVVEATNSIASGAKETAAGISQTKEGVQSLNEAAANLKAIA
ncbi:MAG: CHASE3 domain-containing protein [Proteobacteria bacterium]|nr:CHASE3 domain-containing protein [Pseudomonadota bacterium]MBU4294648.1 CHASE3 domain-containing protein [Pseudomonadota bacterium]MCG2748885.1 methyl-accepting chemotaxis protein [Desulfobulbaceae bacterium]